MTSKTKGVKIRDLYPARFKKPYGVTSRFGEYFNLLMNAVRVKNKTTGERLEFHIERFMKRALFDGNVVGYDKISDKWFYVYGQGINELGDPTQLVLVTANGKTMTRTACYDKDPDGAYMIFALPDHSTSLGDIIKETTDFMANCDLAMRQNLEACKTPYIVVCKNDDLRLSFEHAIEQKQSGQAVVLVSEELGDGLKAVSIGVDYLVDKFAEIRDQERDILLNKLGIMSGVSDKRERVQSAEVNVTLGQATDYIYTIIDTFNEQMETYDIPYEMEFNGSMEEIYLDEDQSDNTMQGDVTPANDIERKETISNGQSN